MSFANETFAILALEFSRMRRGTGPILGLDDVTEPVSAPSLAPENTEPCPATGLTWADTVQLTRLSP